MRGVSKSLLALAALALLAFALSACGGSSDDSIATTTSQESTATTPSGDSPDGVQNPADGSGEKGGGGSSGAVDVNFTANMFVTPLSGSVHFNDGQTTKTFAVTFPSDPGLTDDRFVTLTLSGPTGGANLGSIATMTRWHARIAFPRRRHQRT